MWRLTTLGGLALVRLDDPVSGGAGVRAEDGGGEPATQRRPLALLAVLAAAGERGVPRDRLLLYFWPESHSERARNALRQTLFRLRRDLAAPDLILGADDVRLNPAIITSDVADFERALAAGDLERSVALYRGAFLHGVASGRLPELDEWVASERARLAARFASAVESLASAAEARGDHACAIGWWRRLAAAEPTSARVALGLMTALEAAGDHEGALQYFRLHELLLAEELGVTPDESVVSLVQRVREGRATPPRTVAVDAPPATPVAPPPARTPIGRRRLVAGAALLLAVASTTVVLRARSATRPADPATRQPVVAVLPFAVHAAGGAEAGALDYLREGLVDLLGRDLDGAGALRAADAHAVIGVLARDGGAGTDAIAAGDRVARTLGASHVVLGDVTAAGGRLRVTATIYDRSARGDSLRAVGRAAAEGDTAHVFDVVDQLAVGLLAALPAGSGERLARTAARTTTSLPALRAYLTGEAHYRARRWLDALAAFERAVREDSSFALAHYRLAAAADWAGRGELVTAAAERAYRASGRLGAHDSLLVHAHRAFRRREIAEADHLYREVLARHPDDVEAWYQLGETLFHLNPLRGLPVTAAREPFTRVLRFDPDDEEALLHLLRIAAREGERVEVDTLARRVLARMAPDRQREVRAFRALTIGTPAEADAAIADLRAGTDLDRYVTAWRVASFGQAPAAAARVARLMTAPDRTAAAREGGYAMLAAMHVAQGARRAADSALAAVGTLNPRYARTLRGGYAVIPGLERTPDELRALRDEVRRTLAHGDGSEPPLASGERQRLTHVLGLVGATLGDTATARAAMRALAPDEAAGDTVATPERAMARSIAARLAWRAGDAARALALLRDVTDGRTKADSYAAGLDRFTVGELLRTTGRPDDASGWFASIADISFENAPFLGLAALRLAQIADARGDHARAVAHYRRFAALWRDCDAELRPLVAAAERRIVALRGTQRP